MTSESVVHVLAVITTLPGLRDSVLKDFLANLPAVHAEPGCIEYTAVVDANPSTPAGTSVYGPDTFVVIEKWSSEATLRAHAGAPHMLSHAAKTRERIKARQIYVLRSFSSSVQSGVTGAEES